jgi:hypothetical protein
MGATTVRSDFPDAFRRLRQIPALVRQLMRNRAAKIVRDAIARWPVDTGKSRASIRYEEQTNANGKFRIILIVDAENEKGTIYAPYIRSKGVAPFRQYIEEPGQLAVRELPAEIARATVAAIKSGL